MPIMLNVLEHNHPFTEQEILLPLNHVYQEVTFHQIAAKPFIVSHSTTKTIQHLFPEQEYEEKNIQRTKEVLGKLASNFTQEEIRDLVAQVEYLTETWLDEFERDIFDGRTLNELLHERGGL